MKPMKIGVLTSRKSLIALHISEKLNVRNWETVYEKINEKKHSNIKAGLNHRKLKIRLGREMNKL